MKQILDRIVEILVAITELSGAVYVKVAILLPIFVSKLVSVLLFISITFPDIEVVFVRIVGMLSR